MPGLRHLLTDLGIRAFADFAERRAAVKAFLPQLWLMAETILDANQGSA